MISRSKNTPLLLMVSNGQTRNYLLNLLQENDFHPITMLDPSELLQALKKQHFAIIFVDCKSVTLYGAGIYAKIKVACPRCKIILFGDRSHLSNKSYRNLIKEAMDLGVYGCILSPYEEWEVLSMVKHIFMKENCTLDKRL
jgi:DNA-binding NtrC family response regulator